MPQAPPGPAGTQEIPESTGPAATPEFPESTPRYAPPPGVRARAAAALRQAEGGAP